MPKFEVIAQFKSKGETILKGSTFECSREQAERLKRKKCLGKEIRKPPGPKYTKPFAPDEVK